MIEKHPLRFRIVTALGVMVWLILTAVLLWTTAKTISLAAFFQSEIPPVPAAPTGDVQFVWAGAVTTDSVRITTKLLKDSSQVRLLLSQQPDMSAPIYSDYVTATAMLNNRVVSIPMSDLDPDSQYYYALEVDGAVDSLMKGRFHTFAAIPFTFTIAFGSCAQTGSDHVVFDTIRGYEPLFFLQTGDFHYENISVNDPALYQQAFETILASSTQSALYRDVPIAYVWDDHDYGPNNSDATAPGREAARTTYQQYVPHYPLAAGSGDVPIYQAFSVGRVRFILTDMRSERLPASLPDDGDKSMMGAAQKAWFQQELLAANGRFPLIVWVNSVPWIAEPLAGADHWGGYSTERTEIANFIKENEIRGLIMLSGDAHMLAIDDGTNSDYATGGGAPFPVMHAAALDRIGSTKGGPYSEGTYPGRGQFGLMSVVDNGGSSIEVQWNGRNADDELIVAYNFTVSAAPSSALYPYNNYLPQVMRHVSIAEETVTDSIANGRLPR